ncbi:response regulator [Enterococcus phoeniculicola]|uniref:Transcriptional regulatory protein n=1 Tax=Enterococcus phoeniculicola ATCC BAA-412 TaxID=1158610 RepID=R3WQ88_9ENTE|nr:response regulator [Enterococcus phoeniculicola]EOL43975.1 response regulator [Enterococcus phoeniculicola ATCC BAA-412]EOT75077.1 response regulator [Enterococcus phoeniculicola ATCC BAA-412]
MTSVLIIEDDPMVSFIHQKYLEKITGFQPIYLAETIEMGLEQTRKNQPKLVLLDLHLKDGNGLSYLTSIRKERIDVEVILITAANELDSVKQSMHLGVLDYLIKPFSFERFAKSIQLYQEKQAQLSKTVSDLSQETIDSLFKQPRIQEPVKLEELPLEKGLTQSTLHLLMEKIKQLPPQFTVQELSEISQLSHVSVRKYLLFLENADILTSESVYLKVGRPYQLYRMK